MSIALQMIAVTGIVLGVSALGWLFLWQVYRVRRFCPACKERTLRFVFGYQPTRTAYFVCMSCRAHVRAQVSFVDLLLDSYAVRLRKREYHFAVIPEQERRESFDYHR
jgi:hypothetical protein